jgi:dimethylhistidine N-methyltransferase
LEESSESLLKEYPALEIVAIAGEYDVGLGHLNTVVGGTKLILWLGSNVGNLERVEAARFLQRVRETMSPADCLLVGIDLRKDRAVLESAYDDAQAVTARFNLNLLYRINRELGAQFDLQAFRHRAVYNEDIGRVEMYLVSARAQDVFIEGLGLSLSFAEGEEIHTENSYKYSLVEIEALAKAAGLRLEHQWFDAERRFSENLLAPVAG